ncbi:Metalloenzyme, LuxS/M16 peptidase-like protein [Epithele typhae]|uniref:Metalloenzyme, LuxS/M16 peptidase-like protein n=1 Tax=Epithele typhae TaxID=378194 RepID=UPI002007AB5F|nr:Metalloenzyme, LuxS/M16 peptidase-like protein [Epithele typhae]KAH9915970.1 Metalloenzyme, LuxS/M16 peptidase-like protein [Epithele typhae]
MLAARASAARAASRLVRPAGPRKFATVVESSGLKVAAADNGEPTSSVTLLVKAGSRYETKPGLAHVLKNYAFKSTDKRSTLGTIREAELYGGVLSSSLSREHLAITADFLRGDEGSSSTSSHPSSPRPSSPATSSRVGRTNVRGRDRRRLADPATRALELAHALAFRAGLGNSLFGPAHTHVSAEDVQAFAASAFTAGNVAVVGSGIDPGLLEHSSLSPSGSSPQPPLLPPRPRRLEVLWRGVPPHSRRTQTVFIGFGAQGASAPELAVLAAHLDPSPAVKWTKGTSPLAAAGATGADVKPRRGRRRGAQGRGSLGAEELQKAVAKAKFAAASSFDHRDGLVAAVAPKLDKVTASGYSQLLGIH